MAKSVEEMTEMFIKNGWNKNISFVDFTLQDAEKIGSCFIVNEIKKGKCFYKMEKSGNIYDEKGKLVMFDLKPINRDLEGFKEKCPYGGDIENDCDECAYSGIYHFSDGECVRRPDTMEVV